MNIDTIITALRQCSRMRVVTRPKRLLGTPLIPAMGHIATNGFGTCISVDDIIDHVMEADFMVLSYDAKDMVGFACYQHGELQGIPYVYLAGSAIDTLHQRQGYFMQRNSVIAQHCDTLVLRTQNPIVYDAFTKLCTVYPNPREETPSEIEAFAHSFAKKHNMQINDTFVEEGTYEKSLYHVLPTTQTTHYFQHLGLNAQRGDSMVLVGKSH